LSVIERCDGERRHFVFRPAEGAGSVAFRPAEGIGWLIADRAGAFGWSVNEEGESGWRRYKTPARG
jgi:hypothetical protein